ncbi:tetratricopeptide repeat-containing sensor histidine kinase [Clostridiisalibacter paucivorans]|uniref:tetratricopeptide repeat-containing sensor histidine kinase n=1 Tax=Clostridiisalibacter paucivorans TaxID=408753 RepID=UPI00047B8F36|nr:tetratricopeptide repeat-containing sensor histidine kinase [Clostridiisalibacter paucivorans]
MEKTKEIHKNIEDIIESAMDVERTDPKKVIFLGKKAYKLSNEYKYELGMARSLLTIAYGCRRLSYHYKSIYCLYKCIKVFKKFKDYDGQLKSLILLSINYFYFGRYKESLDINKKAVKMCRKMKRRDLEASILNNIGEILKEQYRYKDALKWYMASLKIAEDMDNKYHKAVIIMNMGFCYYNMGEDEKALSYYNRCLKYFVELSEGIYEADTLNKIGEIYGRKEEYDKALEYYYKSIDIFNKQGNKFYMVDVLMNLGSTFLNTGEYDKAYRYIYSALTNSEYIDAKKKITQWRLLLSDYYNKTKDFKRSLEEYKLYHRLEKEVADEKLERELKYITSKFEKDRSKDRAQIYKLKNIELKRTKDELERAEIARRRLFSNISHELKTPITSIQGYIEAIIDGVIPNKDMTKYLFRMKSRAETLNRIIDDLFQLAKLEMGQYEFEFKKMDISFLLESLYEKFQIDVNAENRKIVLDIDKTQLEGLQVNIDVNRLDQVFGNIIYNSIKYTDDMGEIVIGCNIDGDKAIISIADDGIGISNEDIYNIFERFYKGNNYKHINKGSGLGLSIAKEIINSHQGTIWMKKRYPKGVIVSFTLPVEHY